MVIDRKRFWLFFGICLLVAACSSTEGDTSSTPEPETVLTAAAETANAQLTELAKPQPTDTSAPGAEGSDTLQTPPESTDSAPQQTPGGNTNPTATPATGGVDYAEFSADVTIPDGTDFDPGADFTKVWQLRNSGTNTWTTEYSLTFFTGEQMSASEKVQLSGNVPPGETIDVAVDMVAPQAVGTYTGFWKMQDPAGEFFEYAVFVQIDVVGDAPSGTPLPKPSGDGQVTNAFIQVDDAAPDDCPHTFTFTASFTLSEATTVTYRMEAGSETPGFTYNLPAEMTGIFDAGTHSVVYYLQIQDPVTGWAQFHILAPNEEFSNQASFSLSCGS
ncbi:MAG: hypothetical protein JSV69_06755 [Chloroflexota bacterium]|nr:MAG: hypothetical protein JSV69_06755 [Chloroflexota bacterium]